MMRIPWSVRLILFVITVGTAQEDSLQSALNAVDRRQRDLTQVLGGYKNLYNDGSLGKYYSPEDRDDLAFLKPVNTHPDRKALERALLDYLDDDEAYDAEQDEGAKKHFSSSFRERIEKDKARQKQELEESLINKLENDHETNEDNDEYSDIVYEKYPNAYPEIYEPSMQSYETGSAKKRLFPSEYYTNLGYDSVGMKKRSRYFEPDGPSESLYLLNYAPRDEIYDRLQEEDVDVSNPSSDYYNLNKHDKRERPYLKPYSMRKRFPVSKRSNPSLHHDRTVHQHKRSSKRTTRNLATDPKVAKELSDVLGTPKPKPELDDKPKKKNDKSEKTLKSKKGERDLLQDKGLNKNKTIDKKDRKEDKRTPTKEEVPILSKEEPLQIKKKSIDWSDYFGYDRKKKSDDELDDEWLLERYHKLYAMATKRGSEYPLQSFKNHDELMVPSNSRIYEKKNNLRAEEAKLDEMDEKLKNIEDSIVDEALKYTGAHEGATDSKEVQEIKDKVISRLAAAYSLEKMRQALGEYKQSIEKQRQQLKESGKLDDPYLIEEKRVSVPRKQAIDEERERVPDGDNRIKCSQADDEDCEEETYRSPSEILVDDSHYAKVRDCPKVQRACHEVTKLFGEYTPMLEPACNMLQACLLCSENSWFGSTHQCNFLFLSKAGEDCEGNDECESLARHFLRPLVDLNRSLRSDLSDDCDLLCPDNRR